MRMIWATRGRDWDYAFLRDGGFSDPLPVYEEAFNSGMPGAVAFHLADPEGRTDRSGRIIEHDFVVFDERASVDPDAIWKSVAKEYAKVWVTP